MSYYNTTNESGQLLMEFKEQAKNQEAHVYDVYRSLNKPLSPSEVLFILVNSYIISKDTPITSIRRAITNLTGEEKLRKTTLKKLGKWGKPEYKWMIS